MGASLHRQGAEHGLEQRVVAHDVAGVSPEGGQSPARGLQGFRPARPSQFLLDPPRIADGVAAGFEARKRFTVADHTAATEGVECRKDDAVIEETPMAYKVIDAVEAAQSDRVGRDTL